MSLEITEFGQAGHVDWTHQIDLYCERTDWAFWSEPTNALTNIAFLIAAVVVQRRLRGAGIPVVSLLTAVLALIGVGSFLFHTYATQWASAADVAPIAAFVLIYLYAANRHFWQWPVWASLAGTAAFLPFAVATSWVFLGLPFLQISAVYWPIAALILIYAIALRRRAPETARGLGIGAGLLTLSLVARSVDEGICPSVPVGTHFLWHILNSIMLGWMIVVLGRHVLAGRKSSH